MKSRYDILIDLVNYKEELSVIKKQLSQYSFDSEEPLFTIKKDNINNLLERVLGKEISFSQLEEWANLIECRDDINFENEDLKEIIFEVANPVINGAINDARLNQILKAII